MSDQQQRPYRWWETDTTPPRQMDNMDEVTARTRGLELGRSAQNSPYGSAGPASPYGPPLPPVRAPPSAMPQYVSSASVWELSAPGVYDQESTRSLAGMVRPSTPRYQPSTPPPPPLPFSRQAQAQEQIGRNHPHDAYKFYDDVPRRQTSTRRTQRASGELISGERIPDDGIFGEAQKKQDPHFGRSTPGRSSAQAQQQTAGPPDEHIPQKQDRMQPQTNFNELSELMTERFLDKTGIQQMFRKGVERVIHHAAVGGVKPSTKVLDDVFDSLRKLAMQKITEDYLSEQGIDMTVQELKDMWTEKQQKEAAEKEFDETFQEALGEGSEEDPDEAFEKLSEGASSEVTSEEGYDRARWEA